MKIALRAAVLLSLLCTALARAQPEPAAAPPASGIALVQLEACDPARYDAEAFLRLLELELAQLALRPLRMPETEAAAADALGGALALIAIACAPDADVLLLRVSDLASGKRLERELRLADVGAEARPRALALAAAALLETSLSELAAPSTNAAPPLAAAPTLPPAVQAALRTRLQRRLSAAPAPAAAPAVPEPVPALPPPRAAVLLEAAAALRAFPGRSTGLLGASFGASPPLGTAFRLALSAEALYGNTNLSDAMGKIGVAHLFWLAGGIGLGWVVPGTPELELGPRVLAGYALADVKIERMGASGDDEGGFALCLLASATLRFAASDGVYALLGADLGYAPVGVVFLGDQARLSGMADTTLALRLGVGFR